ncbi:hypothetical protein ACDN41_12430 [Priestia aryabhattai]|uniref:hypothetical protein n=1 Tax=Priestia aryabhattai TaxID=412384 RepID=UPI003531C19E
MNLYHVVVKSEQDDNYKDYITKEPVDKQTATFIKTVLRSQIDDNCFIEFEPY